MPKPQLMSRNGGTFEGFFPSAPSVQQQKRKRAALDRERLELAEVNSNGASSPADAEPAPTQNGVKRPRLSSHTAQDNVNSDAGDLLNGVGSASSLNSTASSVFSQNGHSITSNRQGASCGSHSQTPLTVPESSPDGHRPSTPRPSKSQVPYNSSFPEGYDKGSSQSDPARATSSSSRTHQSLQRPRSRPANGEAKGEKSVYDPDLDPKLSKKERRNPNLKIRYGKFGEKVCSPKVF